jgi:dTDP-4-amino-4,6-dideoxygalactose transaminase
MSLTANRLALFGGSPVRSAPFASRPFIDEQEVDAVAQSVRDGLLSRFVGTPLAETRRQLRQTSAELRVLDEPFSFLGGPNVRRFEADWADAHGARFAVAMNSATSAETSVLLALGLAPGDEVITTPLSFTATATAIVAAQAVPVFADIDPETMCLDPEAVERAITPRTRCILPVHWCGNAGHFKEILDVAARHGLPVVEDAAQGPGSLYEGRSLGSWGVAGTFSFSEPKNVTTGEGGMVVTDDAGVAERCRLIRNHGESVPDPDDPDEYVVNLIGQNFRMTEATAALGWVQTSKLAAVNAIRSRNHHHLVSRLADVVGEFLTPQLLTHPETFSAYTSAFRWSERRSGLSRDVVAAALRAEGIPVATSVGRLMSDNELFRRRLAYGPAHHPFAEAGWEPRPVPRAQAVHDREYLAFFLAGWPNTPDDMDDIADAFAKIAANLPELIEHAESGEVDALPYDRGRG